LVRRRNLFWRGGRTHAFNVLRGAGLANANELAGSVVTRLLGFINQGGVEIALFLFVTAFFVNRNRSRLAQVVEVISIAIMAIMTGVSYWIISARMLTLRASMGTIDQVSPADARRIEFDLLHRYSVTVMGVALVAGLVAFLIASRATGTVSDRGRSPAVRF
jgi:hypothetical protein